MTRTYREIDGEDYVRTPKTHRIVKRTGYWTCPLCGDTNPAPRQTRLKCRDCQSVYNQITLEGEYQAWMLVRYASHKSLLQADRLEILFET